MNLKHGPAVCGALGMMLGLFTSPAIGAPVPMGDTETGNPVLFVTQVPVPRDFATVGSTFANHDGDPRDAGRGGDLYIRYADGTLRNLTREAGYGTAEQFQGADSIAVRQPCVHWSGTKAVFSMVVGATEQQYVHGDYPWQLYEVTGLGQGEAAVITRVPGQPEGYSNISPIYASDGRILFTSDRPFNGAEHLHPQLDEYESTPTVTGLWSLDPATGALFLMSHAPSGAFSPLVDSTGRVIFTKWDHLQRDQQADGDVMYGTDRTFNYTDESAVSTDAGHRDEFFPEPRRSWLEFIRANPDYTGPLRGYEDRLWGHTIERFQPWQLNQDGTEEEFLNHAGRHELASYFAPIFRPEYDNSLTEFLGSSMGSDHRVRNMFHMAEDPHVEGYFYATDAPTFGTHSCGQIVAVTGCPDVNPEDLQVTSITHPDTANPSDDPSPDHSGLYRNPLPLTNGTVLVSHATTTQRDYSNGEYPVDAPETRYDLRLKPLVPSGAHWTAGPSLTGGIERTVSYWNPDVLVTWSGPLWELDAVEVVARTAPPMPSASLEEPEQSAFDDEGVTVEELRAYLRASNQALVVSRDVTTRDRADRQQPFNLRVADTDHVTIGGDGPIYDVAFMRFFQGDLIRGMKNSNGDPRPGRRVLAQPMHDPGLANPPTAGPQGSVTLGSDGSMAALVPARRAMTWQLTDPDGAAVVNERYWLSFQPGEIRSCTSCHGLNRLDQAGIPEPTNQPEALRTLLAHLRDAGHLDLSGDLNGDGVVDVTDLLALLAAWGSDDAAADLNGDGIVDVEDLLAMLAAWS